MQAGQGVILLSPHLGCWEMGATSCWPNKWGRITVTCWLYTDHRAKLGCEMWWRLSRQRHYFKAAHRHRCEVCVHLVQAFAGRAVTRAILPDQVPPQGQGACGRRFLVDRVYTMTLAAQAWPNKPRLAC
jgi:lauroyl/myristoyl acyltransferase